VNDKNLIAYTPDDDKGERDVRNSAKPRKYLTKHFGEVLSGVQINGWAEKFMLENNPVEGMIAMTRGEIRWVYENGQIGCNCDNDDGTGSCMSYEVQHYYSHPIHPVEVYGYGDLGIAYIKYPKEKQGKNMRGIVCARALVWPEEKMYGRIFGYHGNENTLRTWLESQGYNSGNMKGAKMLKLMIEKKGDYEGRFIAPYLDCYQEVAVKDDHLEIGGDGDKRICDSQHGLLSKHSSDGNDNYFVCESCDEQCHQDNDHWYVPSGGTICSCCYNDSFFSCFDCDDVTHIEDSRTIDNNHMVCENCYEGNYFWCETCDSNSHIDNRAGDYKGESICDNCVSDNGFFVKDCGAVVETTNYEVETATCECCGEDETSREEI
jgi:hypothetical protein